MRNRLLTVVSVFIMLSMILTGCAAPVAPAAPAAPSDSAAAAPADAVAAQPSSPGELKIWLLTDDPEVWDGIVADFNAANPEIKTTWEGRSIDGHKEAMRQVINTSAAPDIFFMYAANGPGLGGYYVLAGGVEALDRFYEQYGWTERFTPAAVAASSWDGQKFAIPFRVRTMGLFYSKAAFEKAGITSVPTNYDELVAANEKLIAAGISPLAMGGKFSWMPMRLLDSLVETKCGAETHDQLKAMQLSWTDTPCTLEAFSEFQRWIDEKWMPEGFAGVAPEDTHISVYRGESAMMYEGDWIVPRFGDEGQNADDYGFFHFPADTGRISFFTEELFVTNTSENIDNAAKFLDFVSSPETQENYAGKFGALPPTVNSPIAADASQLNIDVVNLVDQAAGIYIPGDQAFPLDVVNEYWRAQDSLIAGKVTPEEALQIVQDAIDKNITAQ